MREHPNFTTGTLARLMDRTPETVRSYEARGLIPRAHRDPFSGRRYWTSAQVEVILQNFRPADVREPEGGER